MKLKQLVADLPVKVHGGGRDLALTGLCANSKMIAPGNLFIAKQGVVDDGARYIEEAIASGAVAILTDLYNPFWEVAQVVHPNVVEIEGELASRFYGNPSNALFTVGVTGTNGKTSVTFLLQHLFDSLSIPCGLIGTIEYRIGHHHFEAERTTPDVLTNHKLLREMVRHKCEAVAMEVTSHGLAQGRVSKIAFDVAIFTNLSQDHLDYHGSMERYAETKRLLFKGLSSDQTAVVCRESPWWEEMVRECEAKILTYGLSPDADLYAHAIQLAPQHTEFQVTYAGETETFHVPMVGRFNVLNCLAALSPLLIRKFSLRELAEALREVPLIRGRLEPVFNRQGYHIYVDYAHTPDALENVLSTLNELKEGGRIITLFGCGGDRDRQKRPAMGEVASRLSHYTIITSDNPRSETALTICEEIAEGCLEGGIYRIEPDRQKAITAALDEAEKGDLILIAGKGHETYQIFAHQTLPFDDREVVQKILETQQLVS